MKIFLVAFLFIIGTVYAQDSAVIDGKNYLFANDALAADWPTANTYCTSRNMTLVGFETNQEYESVLGWLRSNRKINLWWTNGNNVAGTDSWQWGSQGAAFDNKDSRWGPGEPDGDQIQWQLEHVAVRVIDALFYSHLDASTNHAMCEE